MNLLESIIGQKQPDLAVKITRIREYIEKYHNSYREICDPPYMVIDDVTAMKIVKKKLGEMFSLYMRKLRDASVLCDFNKMKGFMEDCKAWRLLGDGAVVDEDFDVSITMFKIKEITDNILCQEEMCNMQWIFYMTTVVDRYNREQQKLDEDIRNGILPF